MRGRRLLRRLPPLHPDPLPVTTGRGRRRRVRGTMKLGLSIGYSGAALNIPVELVQRAEALGYDSVWTAEAYGSDAVTPLAYLAGRPTASSSAPASCSSPRARRPTPRCAAATVDALAGGGRFIAGLGVSGPQIVEGWYGQPWGKPYWRIRDYVAIMRKIFEREAPGHARRPRDLPALHRARARSGVGKPLKSILHMNPRHPDLARHRQRGDREAHRRDRRRLAAAGLRAGLDAGIPAVAGGRLPPRRRRQGLRATSRSRPRCTSRSTDDVKARARALKPRGGALRRRHGPSRQELPQGHDDPARLRRRRRAHPGAVPGPAARTRRSPPCPTSASTRSRWSARRSASAALSRLGGQRHHRPLAPLPRTLTQPRGHRGDGRGGGARGARPAAGLMSTTQPQLSTCHPGALSRDPSSRSSGVRGGWIPVTSTGMTCWSSTNG